VTTFEGSQDLKNLKLARKKGVPSGDGPKVFALTSRRVAQPSPTANAQIWLTSVYDKDEAVDLSPSEKRALRAAIEAELAQRAARRKPREK
jgi:hypothetical protein